MFVNPSRRYPLVFIFNIAKELKNRFLVYEATRKYWKGIGKYQDEPDMVAVGLVNGIAEGVYRIDKWEKSDNPKFSDRFEFTGHEDTDLSNEFFGKDFQRIIEPAKGYWQFGNWLAVEFDGNGFFRFIRPVRAQCNFPCINAKNKATVHKTDKAVDLVGEEIREKIREIGKLWNQSANKRILPKASCDHWCELIEFWRDCPDLPLVVRKNAKQKGEFVYHPSGREIIFADNSFATWVLCNVLENKTPDIAAIKKLLDNDEIPFMMVANKQAKYKKTLGANATDGWKLCHKEPVGFNSKKAIADFDIEYIKQRFFVYANPKNMFLLPKDIGGIGEIKEFIEEQES